MSCGGFVCSEESVCSEEVLFYSNMYRLCVRLTRFSLCVTYSCD